MHDQADWILWSGWIPVLSILGSCYMSIGVYTQAETSDIHDETWIARKWQWCVHKVCQQWECAAKHNVLTRVNTLWWAQIRRRQTHMEPLCTLQVFFSYPLSRCPFPAARPYALAGACTEAIWLGHCRTGLRLITLKAVLSVSTKRWTDKAWLWRGQLGHAESNQKNAIVGSDSGNVSSWWVTDGCNLVRISKLL